MKNQTKKNPQQKYEIYFFSMFINQVILLLHKELRNLKLFFKH